MREEKLQFNADTVNAFHEAVSALVFALVSEMPKERRDEFVKRLARLAQSKTSSGSILAGTILLDYASAADFAAKNS
jgi:hypothetical protein